MNFSCTCSKFNMSVIKFSVYKDLIKIVIKKIIFTCLLKKKL